MATEQTAHTTPKKVIQTIDPNWVNVTAQAEVVTPTTASEWLSRNINNRPITKNQVMYYARQMREGKWKINGEAICFDKDGNLINGQHRLSAVIEASVPIASLIARGIDADAFATYDSGMNRKISDVFALKGILNATTVSSIVSTYMTLKLTHQSITTNGGGQIANQRVGNQRRSKQEILEEYFSDPEFFQDVYRFSKACHRRLGILMVVKIGAYVSYLVKEKGHDFSEVCDFFTMLTTESSFDNTTIAALRSRLLKNRLTMTNTRMSGLYIQQLIIKTWNAYIKGKDIKFLKWDSDVEGKLQFE